MDETKNKSSEPPVPELLKPQDGKKAPEAEASLSNNGDKKIKLFKARHGTYRPSHKATFIGLGVVVAILAINAVVIFFIMQSQTKTSTPQSDVTISSDVLNKLGVNRTAIGSLGTELTIGPDTSFNGSVTIGGDTSIAGKLTLNGEFSASDATFAKLASGDVTIQSLNVNGNSTISNLTLREGLAVAGATSFQGAVTIGQLLTVNNSTNISGNLSVGGTLSMGSFQTNTLTIGGHVITRGSAPDVSKGWGLGEVDTVSISGNDAAGTVAVNIGSVARNGVVANVSFVNNYSNTPHVIITAVGPGATDVYVNRTSTGFSIGVGSIATGGHAFDYIIMQ